MPSDTLTRPPEAEEDQEAVDDKFQDQISKDFTPEEIAGMEERATGGGDDDTSGESDQINKGYTGSADGKKNRRKLIIGGGIGAALVGGIVTLMGFLQPFFMTHIVNYIEDRVGQVPQYAIERRVDYYMTRYLMMRAIGPDVDPADPGRYNYLGDSFWRNVYTNWRGANVEAKMIENGQKLEGRRDAADFIQGGRLRADYFELVDADGTRTRVSSDEARDFIRQYAKEQTKDGQLWKRHNIRKAARRYFGVPKWKPFEKTYEETRTKYRDKKLAFKKYMAQIVADRLEEKTPLWITCILEAGDNCKNKKISAPDDNPNLPDPDGDAADAVDDAAGTGDTPDPDGPGPPGGTPDVPDAPDLPGNVLSDRISALMKKLTLKRILSGLVAGVGIVDAISKIVQSVDDGSINVVTYQRATQQYAAFAAPIMSAADQFRSGEDFDGEDLRLMAETFKGFAASPVYQAGQSSTAKANEGKSIHRDCNDDGDTDDSEDSLEVGELVCPDKRAVNDNTAFITNNAAWPRLVALSDAWDSTGRVVVDWVTDITDAITSALGVDDFISGVMSALGLDDLVAGAFEFLMNSLFGVVVTGAETGADAFDATYAGMDTLTNAAGGSVGDRSSQDSTLGGSALTDGQVIAIKQEMQEQRDYELKNMSVFARYFSPEVTESLTSYAIMNNPGVGTHALQSFAGMFKFSNLASIFSNLTTKKVGAIESNTNPFKMLTYGFPKDHPIFTDNDGDGMDPDVVNERYQCGLPAEERPQNQVFGRPMMSDGNQLPFEVQTEADPCMLEERAIETATMWFTSSYDEGIDAGTSSGSATGELPTGGVTADDLGPVPGIEPGCHRSISENATRMIEAGRAAGVGQYLTGSCWRDPQTQINLRRQNCPEPFMTVPSSACSPPTAIPGTSNHERGLAIDFSGMCFPSGRTCPGNPGWVWLTQHASQYGFFPLDSEAWHWSVDGG